MYYAIINRFEGDFAVCEINGEVTVSIERKFLPIEARPGSAFVLADEITSAVQEILKQKKVNVEQVQMTPGP